MSTIITHELKIISLHFNEVLAGRKTHEVRFNDRNYQVGDCLNLQEIDSNNQQTGQELNAEISHIFPGGQYGLSEGWCVLSLKNATARSNINLIKFLHDRLQETCDCIEASYEIVETSGHSNADSKRTVEDGKAFIELSGEFLTGLGEQH